MILRHSSCTRKTYCRKLDLQSTRFCQVPQGKVWASSQSVITFQLIYCLVVLTKFPCKICSKKALFMARKWWTNDEYCVWWHCYIQKRFLNGAPLKCSILLETSMQLPFKISICYYYSWALLAEWKMPMQDFLLSKLYMSRHLMMSRIVWHRW